MSGFLRRNQVNTTNPAGGVNPALSPNVGQYGWTNYDAANVNQIIQYVDLCKKYSETTKDHADYVESKFSELQAFITYLEDIYQQIGPIFDNIDIIYKDILAKHGEVTTMHSDVRRWSVLAVSAADASQSARDEARAEAVKSQSSADASAVSANQSEASKVSAEAAAKDAADIAEELRKGQVYRGTWNIESNNSFPPKPDTNSVWDIVLNESSISFVFAGETWYWGDRLLYLKDDDQFTQIESGSGVVSVNGKSGAVTLTYTDVHAAPEGFGLGGEGKSLSNLSCDDVNESGFYSIYAGTTGTPDPSGQGPSGSSMIHTRWGAGAGASQMFFSYTSNRVFWRRKYTGAWEPWQEFYTTTRKPNASDVGAVGLTGDQVMTGQLSSVKFVASDSYALVSKLNDKQGIYMGNNANDNRTIIGGGPLETQQGVLIRPGGITTPTGETLFNPDGTITVKAEATQAYHLSTRGYVDTGVKTASDKADAAASTANAALPKSGGTLTGPIIVANTKGAIKVNDQKSISYQDQGHVMYHNFASGNKLVWAHGNGGENPLLELTSDGTLLGNGPHYTKVAFVARNRESTNWLGLEAPEGGSPYISAQSRGEAGANVKVRFNPSHTVFENGRVDFTEGACVQTDAGLKFAPYSDLSGITWGLGIHPETRFLALHKYQDGAWQGQVLSMGTDNALRTGALVVQGGSESTYHQIRNDGNPSLELHQPGNSAVMAYKPVNKNVIRFCQSNGAGGEANGFGEVSLYGFETVNGRFSSTYLSSDRSWTSTGQNHFHGNPSNVGGHGTLYGLIGKQVNYSGHWSLEQYYGNWVGSTNANDVAHTFVSTDGGGYLRQWFMYNDGRMQSPSTHAVSWSMLGDGNLMGSAFGGYGGIVAWCNASFAPLSDSRKKTILGESTKSALGVIDQFSFKKFVWNEDAGEVYTRRDKKVTEIGLIAQEVEAVDPNFVKDIKTVGENGVEIKALDTASLLAIALKAIQEQQAEINELKEKFNEFILK